MPLLDYCVNVWGHTSQTHLDCIYRLQKRIVRIISNDHVSSINILFQRLNIMTIYERIKIALSLYLNLVLENILRV